MGEDVAVVEPPAGVVLDEPDRRGLVGTDGRGVDERSGGVLPAVAVDVEVVKVVVHPEDVEGDLLADLRPQDGGVAGVRAAVDALERAAQAGDRGLQLVQEQRLLDRRARVALGADDDGAEHPAERVERVVGPVDVIRPRADALGDALPGVGELLAGLDEAAGAGVVADVDPVVLRVVLHAVGMHRHRLGELALQRVAEVHDQRVAHLGDQLGPGDLRRAEHGGEALGHLLVDGRGERRAARDRRAVPVVALARHDRPLRRGGLDPVLDLAAARLGRRRDERLLLGGPGAPGARHLRCGGVGLGSVAAARHRDLLATDRAQEGARGADLREAAAAERRVERVEGIRRHGEWRPGVGTFERGLSSGGGRHGTTWLGQLSKTFERGSCTVTVMAGPPPATSAPNRGRRDRRGEQRRAELLEATIHLIGAQGLAAVPHRAVAAEAGVPAASTSYYFRSKDELIDEALQTLATREIERLRQRRAALGGAAADLEATTDALSAWIEEQGADEGRVAMLAQYQLQLEAARRPEARVILQAWKEGTDDLAETAMRALGARDVRTAGILLVCAIDGLRLRLMASGHEPLRGPELRAVVRALLVGLVGAR